MANLVDRATLKNLMPPSGLNADKFLELAGKAEVESIPAGKVLFKEGDVDRKTTYLLEGELALSGASGASAVKGGTDTAKRPIANQQPRQVTATTRAACKVVRFDSDLLDIMLTWDQLSGIEVEEISADEDDDDSDWMTRILQSQAFLQVPPANIQAMFMRMQEFAAKAGDTIIKQGDEGDYYYIIKHGTAKVTRASTTGNDLVLAQLSDGDAFGEEALLSDSKRNANIIMATDGMLMRLSKEDFNELLKEPMLAWLTMEEAQQMVAEGAKWLDVRLDREHKENGIEGSMNVPLFMLRLKADALNPDIEYIVYCDTGRRSSAAAFLLSERGFVTHVLKGGLLGQESAG